MLGLTQRLQKVTETKVELERIFYLQLLEKNEKMTALERQFKRKLNFLRRRYSAAQKKETKIRNKIQFNLATEFVHNFLLSFLNFKKKEKHCSKCRHERNHHQHWIETWKKEEAGQLFQRAVRLGQRVQGHCRAQLHSVSNQTLFYSNHWGRRGYSRVPLSR